MAATVELIDGFRYEIAGSVQFPTASAITKDLGLDTLPTVEPDVMSTNIGEHGEEAMVFYRDPMQLMTHLSEKHGIGRRDRDGRTDRLEPGARAGARALRRSQATQDPRRDVCLRSQRGRTPRHPRDAVRVRDGCHRPLPARQGEARGHARDARVPGGQLDLPRTLHARQRHLSGVRSRGARGRRRDDDQAQRRHRRAHRPPARALRLPRRRAAIPHQGRGNPRRARRGEGRAAARRVDAQRADRGIQPGTGRHAHRSGRGGTRSRRTGSRACPVATTALRSCRCTSPSTGCPSSPRPTNC